MDSNECTPGKQIMLALTQLPQPLMAALPVQRSQKTRKTSGQTAPPPGHTCRVAAASSILHTQLHGSTSDAQMSKLLLPMIRTSQLTFMLANCATDMITPINKAHNDNADA